MEHEFINMGTILKFYSLSNYILEQIVERNFDCEVIFDSILWKLPEV